MAPKAAPAPTRAPGRKRKAVEDIPIRPSKKPSNGTTKSEEPAKSRKQVKTKAKTVLTTAPKQVLEVFVFGGNSAAELGLGDTATSASVKRPRLNPNLAPDAVGVVHLAVGGMHCLALAKSGTVYSWGGNDLGALGRDTNWAGGLVDMSDNNSDSSDDDDEGGKLNPKEATPTPIDSSAIPANTVFTQLAASDNASFALTDDGLVYGWGIFRGTDGDIGFSPSVRKQEKPVLLEGLKGITKIAAGENHVLALDAKGSVYVWGAGELAQLGRRITERNRLQALIPWRIGSLKNIVEIGTGSSHSFAIAKDGRCFGWGQNNYGQTGIESDAGESGAIVPSPKVIEGLRDLGTITSIGGGNAHSYAITSTGKTLVWGRLDACATGQVVADLDAERVIKDERGRPRILKAPTELPLAGTAECVASGGEHCIAVLADGKAYSWGFSDAYRTGLGTDDDVATPRLIDNTAVREKKLVWAGAGGQFGVVAAAA
ncbi:hypothetical protein FH972_024576 [Carpinus fangiana]|uniref:RCC1-like domain-containing protein n=1 Tax=Carpinus fangiana TaxID=176857 RepID=A0A5N6KYX6_9ROSI|nr:hypothetical protein FH972_024576 [Carpinus fangiana]